MWRGQFERRWREEESFPRRWNFIPIQGKMEVQRKQWEQKEREVFIYEMAQVFCVGNSILLCDDDDDGIQEKLKDFAS